MEPLRFAADKGVRMGKLCLRHASIQVTKMSQKVSRKEGIGKPLQTPPTGPRARNVDEKSPELLL